MSYIPHKPGQCDGWSDVFLEGMCAVCFQFKNILTKHREPSPAVTCHVPSLLMRRQGAILPNLLPTNINTRSPHKVGQFDNYIEPIRNKCISLGPLISPCPLGDPNKDVHHCLNDEVEHGRCWRTPQRSMDGDIGSCQSCPKYDDGKGIPKVGIALGCYGWPNLAETQVALLRVHCGDTPILLCDDGSPYRTAFEEIASRRMGVMLRNNQQRLGHYAGDVSVLKKALEWARDLGLDYVAKVSQRMMLDQPNWLVRAARFLRSTNKSVLATGCFDNGFDLFVRSELMLLDVKKCARPPVIKELDKKILTNPAELHINHVVETLLGGKVHWRGLPVERYRRAEKFIWHCSHTREEFAEVARRFGIEIDKDFHTGGAEADSHKHRNTWLEWKRG